MKDIVVYDAREIIYGKLSSKQKGNEVVISKTIENYLLVLRKDEYLNNQILYNEFSNVYEHNDGKNKPRMWQDLDTNNMLHYIEKHYDLYDDNKFSKALSIVMDEKKYHPIKDIIENKPWDGISRIDNFLKDIVKCNIENDEDEIYYKEVSRMIFYGGIARLYNPGCKFDYMPILVGKQGLGKSTIVRWLAIHDEYEKDINTVEGDKAIEVMMSGWICEFSELLAFSNQKNIQAIKAFVTRLSDTYRTPYSTFAKTLPRHCIFIGTTNEYTFLNDITGNRRYLPCDIRIPRDELFEHEDEIRDYILSCWREAFYKMKNNIDFYLTLPPYCLDIAERKQEERLIEDPKLEALNTFLEEKNVGDSVCAMMIYCEAFKNISKNGTTKDWKEISTYMSKFSEWKRFQSTITFEKYGKQKHWKKIR